MIGCKSYIGVADVGLRYHKDFQSEANSNDASNHTPSSRQTIWAAGIVDVSQHTGRTHRGLQPPAQAAEKLSVAELNR